MRRAELGLLLLLAAGGSAAAHGVHDLRGQLRLEPERLRVVLEEPAGHAEPGRCLRLLDELELRDRAGRRLPVTRAADLETGGCVLDYALGGAEGALGLRLVHSPRRPPRSERLVLALGDARTLVLTGGGNAERIEPLR